MKGEPPPPLYRAIGAAEFKHKGEDLHINFIQRIHGKRGAYTKNFNLI